MMSRNLVAECFVGGVISLLAFGLQENGQPDVDIPDHGVAVMIPTEGNNVRGLIMLQQDGDNVHVTGRVWGLQPGLHGFHIHEYGDLRSADGTAAGDHFSPEGHPHGAPGSPPHHAGDLGNIEADQQGVATIDQTFDFFQVHHVIGRALVVHAEADDLESQPSGDAGARVAVGVIGIANPNPPTQPSGG